MDLVGGVIGDKYRVDRLVGTGRFGSVYAATCTDESRTVALKVFKAALAKQAGGGRRFLRRTRTARKRVHSSIVHIEDQGLTEDGVPYMVMELLEGNTLEQELEGNGSLPAERCISIATVVLEGLAVAHKVGAVHRNLNPANIFLVRDGLPEPPVRILDLGVAKDLVDLLAISPDIIGRTRYLAPELLLFPNMAWTPAVDVFSMGMVMFLMLTGRLPFAKEDYGDDLGIDPKTINLYQKIGVLPGPSTFAPGLPKALDEVVGRALSIELQERYPNAGEMLAALETAKSGVVPGSFDAGPPRVSETSNTGTAPQSRPVPSIPRRRPPPTAPIPVAQEAVSQPPPIEDEDIDVPTMRRPSHKMPDVAPAPIEDGLDGPTVMDPNLQKATETEPASESTQYLDSSDPNQATPVEATLYLADSHDVAQPTVLLDSAGFEAQSTPPEKGLMPPTSLVGRRESAARETPPKPTSGSGKNQRGAPWPRAHKIAFVCACIALLLLTVLAGALIWTATAPSQ